MTLEQVAPKEGVDRDKPSQKLQGTLTYAWSTIQLLQGHPELSSKDWERNLFHSDVCTCPGSCSDGPRLGLQGVDALPPVGWGCEPEALTRHRSLSSGAVLAGDAL